MPPLVGVEMKISTKTPIVRIGHLVSFQQNHHFLVEVYVELNHDIITVIVSRRTTLEENTICGHVL